MFVIMHFHDHSMQKSLFLSVREDILLHEYKDLFIDMDVRNNRSELAIANRHQER